MLAGWRVDLRFDPFGVRVDEVLAGAIAAGEAGFGGVSLFISALRALGSVPESQERMRSTLSRER
jgi:hypothetical protein